MVAGVGDHGTLSGNLSFARIGVSRCQAPRKNSEIGVITMYLSVVGVKPLEDYRLCLTFENGEKRVFDMKPYLEKGIFKELKDEKMFRSVRISFDSVGDTRGRCFCVVGREPLRGFSFYWFYPHIIIRFTFICYKSRHYPLGAAWFFLEERITLATVVDHIKPHKGDERLFFDINNLQPLCKPCHDRKTAKEDGRWRRKVYTY